MTNPYVSEPAYNSEVYTLPPFVSKRVDPVYEQITNKYYCQESVVSAADQFTSLTWKIQQPDMNMVMRSVKVNIPVKINVLDKAGQQMSPLITDRLAACNLALSSSLQSAFTDVNLTLNGKNFNIQPSVYQDVLNKCYTSKDWMAFSDNHSLKPVLCKEIVFRTPRKTTKKSRQINEIVQMGERSIILFEFWPYFLKIHSTVIGR